MAYVNGILAINRRFVLKHQTSQRVVYPDGAIARRQVCQKNGVAGRVGKQLKVAPVVRVCRIGNGSEQIVRRPLLNSIERCKHRLVPIGKKEIVAPCGIQQDGPLEAVVAAADVC